MGDVHLQTGASTVFVAGDFECTIGHSELLTMKNNATGCWRHCMG